MEVRIFFSNLDIKEDMLIKQVLKELAVKDTIVLVELLLYMFRIEIFFYLENACN